MLFLPQFDDNRKINMSNSNADNEKKYTYQEYYEIGLKMVKEDAEQKTDSSETKQN